MRYEKSWVSLAKEPYKRESYVSLAKELYKRVSVT